MRDASNASSVKRIDGRRAAWEDFPVTMPDTDRSVLDRASAAGRLLPATIPQRLGAWAFDCLLICVTVAVPALLVGWWFGPSEADAIRNCRFVDGVERCSPLPPEALRFSRAAFWTFATIYLLVFVRATTKGRSVGKRATESEVVDARTGEYVGWARAALRTVVAAVGTACFGLSLLVALTNRERRTLHDLVAGTRVISP